MSTPSGRRSPRWGVLAGKGARWTGGLATLLALGLSVQIVGHRSLWFLGLALAVVGAGIFVVLPNSLVRPDAELTRTDLLKARNDVRTAGIQIVGGAALLGGLLFTYQANQVGRDTLEVTQQSQITERFTRAIEQLGSDKADVRLGGIYALGRIAEDSNADAEPIIKILAAYLRGHQRLAASVPPPASGSEVLALAQGWRGSCVDPLPTWATSLSLAPADVQAVITVLQPLLARHQTRSLDLSSVDLGGTNLRQVPLPGANLSGANLAFGCAARARLDQANLDGAVLSHVDLSSSQLQGASLRAASLPFAILTGAVLSDAKLPGADLSYAGLGGAKLQRANLIGANLSSAFLFGADLQGAFLQGADLTGATVTQAQIDSATTDDKTKLSAGLRPHGRAASPVTGSPSAAP